MTKSESQGYTYQDFMARAFNTSENSKPGMHHQDFTNIVDMENGESWVEHLGNTRLKRFEKIKTYVHKAMDKFLLNNKIEEQTRLEIQDLKNKIDQSQDSADLFAIIEKTMDLTQSLVD